MPRTAVIETKTIHVGVSALARETGLSQGYVSKLLGWGWPLDAIRKKAEWAACKREMRERMRAARERFENRRY